MTTPSALSIPSTSTPSSLGGGVTLEAIMTQLQHIDARLNTLSYELCQVTTHVGRITRRQARLSGFVASPSPSSEAFKDEDAINGTDDDDDDKDKDANSSSDEEMTTS